MWGIWILCFDLQQENYAQWCKWQQNQNIWFGKKTSRHNAKPLTQSFLLEKSFILFYLLVQSFLFDSFDW